MYLHMDLHDMAPPPDNKPERYLLFKRLHYAHGIQSHNNANELNAGIRPLICRYTGICYADITGRHAALLGWDHGAVTDEQPYVLK